MTDRLGPLAPQEWNAAQRAAAQQVIEGPRGALYGPFVPLLRSPELMACAQKMGEYLRYRSALEPCLSELAILVTARHWNQQVEWAIHAPIAAAVGVPQEAIEAIAAWMRPEGMDARSAAVHDFCIELQRHKRVSDDTYEAALRLFGEQGVVDLMGIAGYYTFLSMVMNAAQTAPPFSTAAPLPD